LCSVSAVFTTGAARGLEQWSITVPTQWLQVQAAVGLGSAGPGKLSGYWRYICKATVTENSSYAPASEPQSRGTHCHWQDIMPQHALSSCQCQGSKFARLIRATPRRRRRCALSASLPPARREPDSERAPAAATAPRV